MAGRVITVTSGKGGVGKSTTTANLAMGLALAGSSVICIDGDVGLRNLDVILGLENRIVYDITHVIDGRCKLRQALVRDRRCAELHLLPAAQTRDKSAVSPEAMVWIAQQAAELVDYVLIDCPAGIEQGFWYSVAPADELIVVTNPELPAVRDADRVIGLLESDGHKNVRLIINRMRSGARGQDQLDRVTIVEMLGVDLLGVVPEDSGVTASSNRGEPVVLDPKSAAGQSFRAIARRLRGEDAPEAAPQALPLWKRLFARSR